MSEAAAAGAPFDHILLIGFGGPTKPEEVRPFLERFAQGARIPEDRLREVEHHYQQTGGFSPYNSHAARLLEKLSARLPAAGVSLPAFLGMRNWHPFLAEVIGEIRQKGLRRGLGLVLAPHRCEASFGRYVSAVEQAKQEAGAGDGEIQTEYLAPWYSHPLFIEAQAQRVREVWGKDGPPQSEWLTIHLLFTAHSVPVEMAKASRYAQEIQLSSARAAAELGGFEWGVAYQSRSDRARVPAGRRVGEGSAGSPAGRAAGPPGQAWLEPDIAQALPALQKRGKRKVVAVPIGFLFDHTEVLYDLDIEAKQAATAAGLEFLRAPTVMDHPKFVEMLATLIAQQVSVGSQGGAGSAGTGARQ